jgi:hypothetical protein
MPSYPARLSRATLTIKLPRFLIIRHLIVAQCEVVQALPPACGLGAVDVLEEADTLDMLVAGGSFDEAPGVVELGLGGDVRRGKFSLVLNAENLQGEEQG